MEAAGLIRKRVADVAAYDRFYKKFIAQVVVSEISASFVMEDIKDISALPLSWCGARV